MQKSDILFVYFKNNAYFCPRFQKNSEQMMSFNLLNGLIIIRLQECSRK